MEPERKINILLVDDRLDTLLALESILADPHQNIVKARSGKEALQHVLRQDFAVILLDVNMPGMNGFETAELIRLRRSSRHTPIIFVTGYSDEMHEARGYALGAVDYILAPVVPEVLRTKVAVFVDLFEKTQQVERQADSLRQYAQQLQKLAAASMQINSAQSIERMLQIITDAARDVVGAHQSITLFLAEHEVESINPVAVSSFSEKYARWRRRSLDLAPVTRTVVASGRTATRLTEDELRAHPDWEVVSKLDIPPVCGGMLAAPLTGHDDKRLGVLYLADAYDGVFTDEDEHILVQLAQKASIAIENILSAEAREANRLKDEFLATLSHELRTPLNAMLGWTRLLRTEELDETELAHGLEVIERNVNAQSKLIEDLLDVSRINSGKLQMELGPMNLAPIIEAAVDTIRPAADAKGVRFEAEINVPMDRVSGDPDRLRQVVWNLLSNALKFTPRDGCVRVILRYSDEYLWLRVIDTGEGIDPDLLPHVFDRFRQADSSSTRSYGGLGVGLAIVRHIIEQHGGMVHAESEGHGRGSTFVVKLPVLTVEPIEAERVDPAGDGQLSSAEAQSLEGLRVLVVDDEPDARELIGEVLRRHQARVTVVASVREALHIIEQSDPDVLVSDIAMPGEDGYALIRSVRERQGGRPLPAVALTAYAAEEDRARALAAGFNGHITKPIEPAELVAAIAGLSDESLKTT